MRFPILLLLLASAAFAAPPPIQYNLFSTNRIGNTNQFTNVTGSVNIKDGAALTNSYRWFKNVGSLQREPFWDANDGFRYFLRDSSTNGIIFEMRPDAHPNKGIYIGSENTSQGNDFISLRARGYSDLTNTYPYDPRITMEFGFNDFREWAWDDFRYTYKVGEGGFKQELMHFNIDGTSVTNFNNQVTNQLLGREIIALTNVTFKAPITNLSSQYFTIGAVGAPFGVWFLDPNASGGNTKTPLVVEEDDGAGDSNIRIGSAHQVGGLFLDSPSVVVSNIGPNKLIYTDGNTKLSAVTVGSGLTFSGGTLAASGGGGSGAPINFDATQLVTNNAGSVLRIKSGVFETNIVAYGSNFTPAIEIKSYGAINTNAFNVYDSSGNILFYIDFSGSIRAKDASITNNLLANALIVTNNATVGGTLDVTGAVRFASSLQVTNRGAVQGSFAVGTNSCDATNIFQVAVPVGTPGVIRNALEVGTNESTYVNGGALIASGTLGSQPSSTAALDKNSLTVPGAAFHIKGNGGDVIANASFFYPASDISAQLGLAGNRWAQLFIGPLGITNGSAATQAGISMGTAANGLVLYDHQLLNVTKTANYTVLNSDSGAYFNNTGAGGAATNTLPTAAAGMHYSFYVDASQILDVKASGTDTIRNAGTVSAAAGDIFSSTTGSTLHLFSPKAGVWIIDRITGTWTGPQ